MTEQTVIAEELAKQLRAVSVAEFFEKNRHLLGYENPTKALITIVKEFTDNALDAAEEARILPDIKVVVKEVAPDRFKVRVEDNGPGIVEEKLPLAFGKLLYGSKFHRLKMSRGTQGLGASGGILYAQLTTGRPAKIISSTGKEIHEIELMIDVSKNEPKIISHKEEKNPNKWHGIKIEVEAEGRYIEGKQSILEYLKQTAMSNPYAKIVYDGPNGKVEFERAVKELPPLPKEIKPHPYGVEIGLLRRMLEITNARNLIGFLTGDFSRVGRSSALQICKLAKLDCNKKPNELTHGEIELLHKAMQMVKLIGPPTDCLSPLGEKLLEEGLKKETKAEFVVAVTRSPTVYRGNPFLVEVCLGFGGELPQDQTAQLFRFANKVPLLYHAGDCATTEAVIETDWRRYGFSQSSGQLPQGQLAILIHFASVWVPYTSEGKQAIASYPEIVKEIKLALQEAGRKLATYVRHKNIERERALRQNLFERYLPEVSAALSEISETPRNSIEINLKKILNKGKVIESVKEEGIEDGEENRNESEE
ncbi:MAG: DNA topoisomerase VI subunit B [Candidatus Aenigmatarchaeota archaeon]|nr:DNA topoisomerase VI subunit B [Candidatus Aenigmarchaeota archaeon]